jgi:sensor histidine kinase regulating citrate/malate metabolism
LENAFEGTLTVPAKRRRVNLEILLMAEKLLIEVRNTFDGKIVAGEGQLFNIPLSRKGIGGGYGLRSVAAVCKRHCGEYLPQWKGSEYTVHLLLNL